MAIQPKRHRKADKAEAKRNRPNSKKKNSMGDKAKKSKADSTSIANFLDSAVRTMGRPQSSVMSGASALQSTVKRSLGFDNEAVEDSTVTARPLDNKLVSALDRHARRTRVVKKNPKQGGKKRKK